MKKNKKMHFEISERKILLRIFDVVFVLLSLFLIGDIFNFGYFQFSATNFYWPIVLSIYLVLIGTIFEMYNLQVASNHLQSIKSIILTASTTVLFYLLTPILTPVLPSNRIQILFFFLAVLLSLMLWRMFYLKFLASHRFIKKVVLVCEHSQAKELVQGLESANPHYKVMGYIASDSEGNAPVIPFIKSIQHSELESFTVTNSISEVVVASQKADAITITLYNQLIRLLELGYVIREYTHVYESITQRVPVQYVARDFYRFFPFSRSNQNHLYLILMRFSEVIIATIGILSGIVLIPFIFIGNLIANRGPLFYTQERVGKNGENFTIYKFRTMGINAEANGAIFAVTNDLRVTKFGKFLRKTRMDEFPQFINILKGDMAVIGPRPERPMFVKKIAEQMPFYETRHVIKPGLTGWAQVNYAYGETIDDSLIKLQYDLYYIKHRSLFLDVSIMIKTLSTILFYRGQ